MTSTDLDFSTASVAITGGTGSFGSAMVNHLLATGVGQIHILSRDEAKQDEMRNRLNDDRVRYFIGDIRERSSVRGAFHGVDYVFHAAALKQVPSCEFFPDQAVKTNIQGSANVIEVANELKVSAVVCLSTDKAVYPANAMGMTKALMEKTAQAFARNNSDAATTVSITRYGNVLYSRGSVVPLFVRQIQAGRPLTITDPRMTRFMMTLEESVDLVLHAFKNARPGDLFVRKAPACTVETLALATARLFGIEEPEIQNIGIRHGEKIHETLLSAEEMSTATDQGNYFRVPLDARSLEYSLYYDEGSKVAAQETDFDSTNSRQLSVEEAMDMLRQLPEMRALLCLDR